MTPKAVYDAVARTDSAWHAADDKVIETTRQLNVDMAAADKAAADRDKANKIAVTTFAARPYLDTATGVLITVVDGRLYPVTPYTSEDSTDVPPFDIDGDGEPDTLPIDGSADV